MSHALHETLYNQFKQKQYQMKYQQQQQQARIHNLSNESKININSTGILLKRTLEILDQFSDQLLISLQTSIEILKAVGIIQVVTTVQDARNIIEAGGVAEARVRVEVEFLYHLWEMIDEEEIQCRELKQIIQVLQSKNKNQLRELLPQMYPNQQKCQNLLRCWSVLSANQQYYRHMSKNSKFANSKQNKENRSDYLVELPQKMQQKFNRSGDLGSPIENEKQRSYSNKYFNYSHQSHGSHGSNLSNGKFVNKGHGDKYATNIQNVGDYLYGKQPKEFVYTCQLNVKEEKDLVDRLYRNDIYKTREELKKEREEQRQVQQLSMCTFKPNLLKRPKSTAHSQTQIKGYQKAIHRLKAGTQKSKQTQHLRQYKPIGENYQKLKQKGINPPKFLDRKKKQQQKILFIISFDLGRHKTNVKIRESDNQDTVAERICKIYSLKKEFYEEIRQIVRKQLQMYYEELERMEHQHQEQDNMY